MRLFEWTEATCDAIEHDAAATSRAYRPPTTPVVFVVDDDVSVRESLEPLIRWAGWKPETFSSAQDFLSRPRDETPSCLVLDVELPDLNGLDLQERVAADRADMPIIFITGHGDIPMSVRAMKAGAAEFLTKPFERDVLLDAIRRAIERSREALAQAAELKMLQRTVRVPDPAGTRSPGVGGLGPPEQAGRRRTRHDGSHRQGASRPDHAEDEGGLSRRPGQDRRTGSSCRCPHGRQA